MEVVQIRPVNLDDDGEFKRFHEVMDSAERFERPLAGMWSLEETRILFREGDPAEHVAVVGGGMVGARVAGLPGAFFGCVVGSVLAATRNTPANAILGTAGGALYSLYSYPRQPPLCFLWTLVGLVIGVCLGDWRGLPAPPGSGPGPPLREEEAAANDNE